jgi:group I intron endonuclease
MYIIYRVTNNINKKCYIGFTTRSAEQRFIEHCRLSQRTYFHNAIKKYGKDNFTVDILCQGEDEEAGLNIAESLMIDHFKPAYNHTTGGEGVSCKRSIATRIKMARAAIRRWYKSKPPTNTTVYMA